MTKDGEPNHMRRFIDFTLRILAAAALGTLVHGSALAQSSETAANVQSRGTLRIATVASNPPYSSVRPDGTLEGYDVEVGKALASALNVKPEWVVVDAAGRIASLLTDKADVTIANLTNTTSRSAVILFTRPYLVVGSYFIVRKNATYKTVEDLDNSSVKVAVTRGGTAEAIVRKATPNATLVPFDTEADAVLALKLEKVDARVQDSLQFLSQSSAADFPFRSLPGNWSYEEISIGVPPRDFQWYLLVDGFVRQLQGSGDNDRLFKASFGVSMPKE